MEVFHKGGVATLATRLNKTIVLRQGGNWL